MVYHDKMRLIQSLIFTTMILQASFARYRRPRPNMMALQNILSQNPERIVQMPQRHCNTCNLPVKYSPPILPPPEAPCDAKMLINQVPGAPLPQMPNILPVQISNVPIQYQNPAQIQLPNSAQIHVPNPAQIQPPNPAQIQLPNPMSVQPNPTQILVSNPAQLQPPYPTQMAIANPQLQLPAPTPYPLQISTPYHLPNPAPYELPKPAQIQQQNLAQIQQQNPAQIQQQNLAQIMQVAPNLPEIVLEKPKPLPTCACQREIIYPSPEITTNLFCNPPITMSEPVPLTPNQDIYGCPIPSPASLFNPTLPPASPVSAWTQEVLPEAVSCVRSTFLRKIPIPPPTL